MDMVRQIKFLIGILLILQFPFVSSAQIVIGSKYRPFSYGEMLAPAMAAANYHRECCDKLENVLEKAEVIESKINKEKDPITWKRYCDFYNSVVDEYNIIMKNGGNASTDGNIQKIKKQFTIVINGISNASERRMDLAYTQYQRIMATNEKCDRFYSDISLDEFLDGKTPEIKYWK